MKVKCPVIEDLLPLYIDGICSIESKIVIEEHLKECKICNDKYNIQKSNMILDNNAINENLKSKEPFKKIKKYQFIKLIIILLSIPLIYLSLIEIRGDGVGFSTLYGKYTTNRFLSYIENEEFMRASKYGGFTGGIYQTFDSEEIAKEKWIEGIQKLESDGIDFVSHRENDIKTDDGFTSGEVIISIQYEGVIYDFRLFVSTNSGKVEIGGLNPNFEHQYREPTEVEKMLMDKISKVICTYNPG